MIDFTAVARIKQAWQSFKGNHPKVPEFIEEVRQKGACEGQEIAIAIRYPDGTEIKTGIRVQDSDLEFLETLKSILP